MFEHPPCNVGSSGNDRDPDPTISNSALSEGFCLGCDNLQSVEVRGYSSWEESCLVKFSEFLGFQIVGHEEEIINMLRKWKEEKSLSESREHLGPSKCERELRKLECTINYNGQRSGKVVGRYRGNF